MHRISLPPGLSPFSLTGTPNPTMPDILSSPIARPNLTSNPSGLVTNSRRIRRQVTPHSQATTQGMQLLQPGSIQPQPLKAPHRNNGSRIQAHNFSNTSLATIPPHFRMLEPSRPHP